MKPKINLLWILFLSVLHGYSQNLSLNPGLEDGGANWNISWNASVVGSNAKTGINSIRVGALGSVLGSAEQTIAGLEPSTTYNLSAWLKVDSGTSVVLGTKNFGSTQVLSTSTTTTTYEKKSISFTTGSTDTSATIFIYKNGGTSYGYGDDVELYKVGSSIVYSPGNTNYYINALSGNDSNNGLTIQTAWASLNKANVIRFAAGDKLLLDANSSWTGSLDLKGSGISGNPITLSKYGTTNYNQRPIINGGGAKNVVVIRNGAHWIVSNLEITNPSKPNTRKQGIAFENTDAGELRGIKILHNYIHDVDGDNVKDSGGSMGIIVDVKKGANPVPSWYNDVLIEGNEVVRCDRTAIGTASSWWCRASAGCTGIEAYYAHKNVIIRNNYVEDAGGDGIVPINAEGAFVEYNIVNGANVNSNTPNVGIWCWNSDNVVFQYNEAYNVKTTKDGQGFDIDYGQENTVVQYNYSHNNEGGFVLVATSSTGRTANGIIRYNISQNDYARVFNYLGPSSNTVAYNNTIYLSSGSTTKPIDIGSWGGYPNGVKFYNNIFHLNGAGDWSGWNLATGVKKFDNNIIYGVHTIGEPTGTNNLTLNPLLAQPGNATAGSFFEGTVSLGITDGYKLQMNSPAIGSGILIANNGGTDYWGNTVSSTESPNIGAYNGAAVITTPASNFIIDPGFENNASAWNVGWYASITNSNSRSGSNSVRVGTTSSQKGSAEQIITGLLPKTSYTFTGWLKANNGATVAIGVKNYGGTEVFSTNVTGQTYEEKEINFTTGANNTVATVYVYRNGGTGYAYADDLTLSTGTTVTDVLSVKKALDPSIDEILNTSIVYPNPVKNNLNIVYYADTEYRETFIVMDLTGKEVLQYSSDLKKGENVLQLSIKDLKNDLYILKSTKGKNKIEKKIIINN